MQVAEANAAVNSICLSSKTRSLQALGLESKKLQIAAFARLHEVGLVLSTHVKQTAVTVGAAAWRCLVAEAMKAQQVLHILKKHCKKAEVCSV